MTTCNDVFVGVWKVDSGLSLIPWEREREKGLWLLSHHFRGSPEFIPTVSVPSSQVYSREEAETVCREDVQIIENIFPSFLGNNCVC